ncbi:30S ribosomal protein S2 [Candidatus Woesebacteria bacterium]|nr:30S ribosomal protein S2 [Candidatus Woesebacteria bacterium]
MANQQPNMQNIQELFELGAHLGHKKSRLHPKAKKSVYKIINGTSIIDLTKTVEQLDTAKKFLIQSAKDEKSILVVGTKKVASAFLREYCTTNKLAYITSKWLPGLLTNFETIMKNVHKLADIKKREATGDWSTMVKHERNKLSKEMVKLEKLYGGLLNLPKRPDVIVIVDARKEKNAVEEAKSYKIPIVALIDTNSNPEQITYPVLANDDAAEVVKHIMTDLLSGYVKNKIEPKKDN